MNRYKHNLSFVISSIATTAWMHDHMDVEGRTMPGAIVEEVESRREQRPGNLTKPVISSAARNLALPIFLLTFTPNTFAADDLGRLFTTPQQRNTLEKIRHQEPVVEIKLPEITFEEPAVELEENKPVIGGITVNGLVYRKGGKSTAWVNSANTFEGNLGNQYIQIDAQNIKPDDVEIIIPINETKVKLKTGQTYDPEADQIISPGYQDN